MFGNTPLPFTRTKKKTQIEKVSILFGMVNLQALKSRKTVVTGAHTGILTTPLSHATQPPTYNFNPDTSLDKYGETINKTQE